MAAGAPPRDVDCDWCINVWATPRSLSTSLMYSFAQRPDCEVVDEPLYGHWLHLSGAQHPVREQVMAQQGVDGKRVADSVVFAPPASGKIRFVKHMAKHLTRDIQQSFLSRGRHVLLVREPLLMLSSFSQVVRPSLEETGLSDAVAIYSALKSASPGRAPLVVDAKDLACQPEATLRSLCRALDVPFFQGMLSWQPGPRAEDGVWAPLWYKQVHQSSGFIASSHPYASLMGDRSEDSKPIVPEDPVLYDLLEDCQPFYALLSAKALRPLLPEESSTEAQPLGTANEPRGELAAPVDSREGARTSRDTELAPALSLPRLLDPRLPVPTNRQLLIWVGDALLPRNQAKVHVLDSIAQGGDGTWEGLRVYQGRVFKLQEHLQRLQDSAKALMFERVPSQEEITGALFATLAANGMRNNAHVRLTLTRGLKVTSGMSPHFNQYGCTLIVLAEWKPPVYDNSAGIVLVTASTRRNPPQCLDSKIHHNNLLNNILAKIEGNSAGADDAVMLDVHGFVSETNATNIFMVKDSRLLTPATTHCCLPGITRATVLELAREVGLPVEECAITISQLHSADEIFTTGTMGELTPCVRLDSRPVGEGTVGPITRKLQSVYAEKTASEGAQLPDFPAAAFSNTS